ncbi:MAG: hypothetical protein AB1689_24700, partial [Thermodesulfobacteriota bacterium]
MIGDPSSATITIADDAAIVTLAATDPTASEAGPEAGAFSLTRSGGDVAAELRVRVVRGGTASNGTDCAFISSLIGIPANETSAAVLVTPVVDALVEGDESVTLTLDPEPTYEIGSPSSGAVTIADAPAPSATPSSTSTPSATPSSTPTPTSTPTATASPTPSPGATPSPSATPTPTPSATP